MANGVRRTGTSVLLSLLFLSSTMLSMVAGTTPDDVNVDGDLGEWSADTLMGTDANGVSLHLTWNDTHLSFGCCLLYTSPSPRDVSRSRMPSSA